MSAPPDSGLLEVRHPAILTRNCPAGGVRRTAGGPVDLHPGGAQYVAALVGRIDSQLAVCASIHRRRAVGDRRSAAPTNFVGLPVEIAEYRLSQKWGIDARIWF